MPADLLKSFLAFNYEKSLFNNNEKIGLAVSGGLDSVVLFDLFYQIKNEWNLQLIVLHFDHHLRDESKMDAEFVINLCLEKNIPFECGEEAVAHYAGQHKLSIEMAARDCRYAFFQKMIEKLQLDKIATAHTANDQAETILHHIMRGTGIDGLCGIPSQRDHIIRPLLFAQRAELHQYANEHNLRWREDHSNQDESFTRNRIRYTLLPVIREQFNPQIITALNRLGDSAQEHHEIIQNAGRQAYENCIRLNDENEFVLEIDRFFTYFKSLQRLVLQQVLKALGHDPAEITYNKMAGILAFLQKRQSGMSFRVLDDCNVMLSGQYAVFRNEQKYFNITLPQPPGSFQLQDNLFLEILACAEPLTFEKNRKTEFIDADTFGFQLVVRSPKPADYFYPINGTGRKKLSDFFIDEKVPYHTRAGVPILLSDEKIVWVCGYRLDDRFKVTDKTKRIYKLTIGSRGR